MGKKKGGKKKKDGGKKKPEGPSISETYLAYQITIKEKDLEELLFEKDGVDNKVNRLAERNKDLQEESEVMFTKLEAKYALWEAEKNKGGIIGSEKVADALMGLWQFHKEQQDEVKEIEKQIADTDVEIATLDSELRFWDDYKAEGMAKHDTQIDILQKEYDEVGLVFNQAKGFLTNRHNKFKEDISYRTDMGVSQQRQVATEKAFATLDFKSKEAIEEYKILVHEKATYREVMDTLKSEIEHLEHQNLEHLSFLFDCRVEDLRISKEIFVTTFNEYEDLTKRPMLEVDLATVDLMEGDVTKRRSAAASAMHHLKSDGRPKSAVHRAVEERLRRLNYRKTIDDDDYDDTIEPDVNNKIKDLVAVGAELVDGENMHLHSVAEIQKSLLCVSGHAASLVPPSPGALVRRAQPTGFTWPEQLEERAVERAQRGMITVAPTPLPRRQSSTFGIEATPTPPPAAM